MYGTVQTMRRRQCCDSENSNRGRRLVKSLEHKSRQDLEHDDARVDPSRGEGVGAAARAVVLGFGNVLLSDDGAGVRIVERLRARLGARAAEFIDAGTLSFGLLSYIEASDSLLVIDAADINAAPGAFVLFEGRAMDEFLHSARRRTVHEVGLIDLMDMARLRDCLPRRRALLGIQPDRIDWSDELSAPLEAMLPEAVRQAAALLERWHDS
jgi:hydrogenase maturation protease